MDPSTLEIVSRSLESSLDWWAWWLLGSTFVVAIGLVLEYWHPVSKFIANIRNPTTIVRSKTVREMLGAILITLGVMGEFFFTLTAFRVEGKLRDNNHRIEDALTKEAGDAKNSAADAAAASSTANSQASKADLKATAVSKEADAISDRLKKASNHLTELEHVVSVQGSRWRLLENAKGPFVEALKPFAGQRITLVSCGSTAAVETFKLQQDLMVLLGKAGAGWALELPGYAVWAGCTNGVSSVGGNLVIFNSNSNESVKRAGTALADELNGLEISTVKLEASPQVDPLLFQFMGPDSPWTLASRDPTSVFLLVGLNPMFDLAGWHKGRK